MSKHAKIRAALPREAHVFLCRTEQVDAKTLARHRELLDTGERQRLSRFRFEPDARSFVIAHALARKALSVYADVSPDAWQFCVGAHGRPQIAGPAIPALHFNLSHTRELVACVVTDWVDAGIDVEAENVADDPLDLAARIFSPGEIEDLRSAPIESRRARFLSIWTLKEAYSKARGLGLSLPLDRFSFRVDREAVAAFFESNIGDRPEDWSFCLMHLAPRHWLAVAARLPCSIVRVIQPLGFAPVADGQKAEARPRLIASTSGLSCHYDSLSFS